MITWERAKPRQSWLMHGADKACRGFIGSGERVSIIVGLMRADSMHRDDGRCWRVSVGRWNVDTMLPADVGPDASWVRVREAAAKTVAECLRARLAEVLP